MLPPKHRLTKKTDFQNVYQNGRFLTSKDITISIVNRKDGKESRFGFVVSKKISTKATDRNRVKRLMRESVWAHIKEIPQGCDYVITAKSGIIHLKFATIDDTLRNLLEIKTNA
jgi:ribonuclease P protein component